MSVKDLHEKPFTEETITKLNIFEDYAKVWIPTFVMSPWCAELNIFDFFARTGYDKNGVEGIRDTLDSLREMNKEYVDKIFACYKR